MIPAFLAESFEFNDYRPACVRCLYVALLPPAGGRAAYVPITETPHYGFAQQILSGQSTEPVGGYEDYGHYATVNAHACTEQCFIQLIDSLKANGYDSQKRPILVFRSWRRPWPLRRWDVADGFHRLAVLAALGETTVLVGTLRPTASAFRRIMNHRVGV